MKESPEADLKSRNLLRHIYEISYLLTQIPDIDQVFNNIIDHIITGLNYDRAIIMLLNEDGTKLECRSIRGFTTHGTKLAWEKPLILNRHDCYETKLVRRGEPLFIPDILKDPGITDIDRIIAKNQERKSFLHVPLKIKSTVLGTIGVDRYLTKMKITPGDVEDLAIFANQAAIVIENARLYNEKRRIDEHLIRVEKFAALGGMVAGIAHEIRNPMAAIFTTIQHIEKRLEDDSPHKYALQNVTKELDRIEGLIRELLNATHPSPLHPERIDVKDILERAIFFVKRKKGESNPNVKFEMEGDNLFIDADPNRLMQVFLNVLINSVESVKGQSGKVKINLNTVKDKGSKTTYALIKISDNGAGMNPAIKTKIFDPFFTTKNNGTGLGLTVSHKIIQDHKGFIEVESKKSQGTNVIIKLPMK